MTPSSRSRRLIRFILTIPLLVLAGCARGERVTHESLRAAKQRWEKARVDDYNLEWTNTGPGNPRYRVSVRGGKVRTVLVVGPDGKTHETTTHEPRYFGVEGLFLTIADDVAQLQTDRPFGLPKGASAVLRFTPDPKFGFPTSYRRDISGAPRAMSFDVVRFEPNPPSAPPGQAP